MYVNSLFDVTPLDKIAYNYVWRSSEPLDIAFSVDNISLRYSLAALCTGKPSCWNQSWSKLTSGSNLRIARFSWFLRRARYFSSFKSAVNEPIILSPRIPIRRSNFCGYWVYKANVWGWCSLTRIRQKIEDVFMKSSFTLFVLFSQHHFFTESLHL